MMKNTLMTMRMMAPERRDIELDETSSDDLDGGTPDNDTIEDDLGQQWAIIEHQRGLGAALISVPPSVLLTQFLQLFRPPMHISFKYRSSLGRSPQLWASL